MSLAIKDMIKEKSLSPIFFVTPSVNRAIGLEKELGDFHIVCSQNSDVIEYMRKDGVNVFCLNDERIKNSGKLLESAAALSYVKEKSKGQKANIITFKPSPKAAKICADNGFNYLGNDWKLNRRLENKVEFVSVMEKLKIPGAKCRAVKLEEGISPDSFKELEKGCVVIQLPRGFSGNSTFLVKSKSELEKLIEKYKNRTVKVSEFLEGETYTIDACVGEFGVAISQPIYQITGLTDFNKNKLGTSGNDYAYAENLDFRAKERIFSFTQKVGNYMKSLGYKGIFGLDLIVNGSNVDLVEINPRFVGSISVITKLQLLREEIPFLYLHIAEFLGSGHSLKVPDHYLSFESWSKKENFQASQLILRNTAESFLEVAESLPSGIYKKSGNEIALEEKSYYATRILSEDEFFIQCAQKGSAINPDMEYANIQAGCGIMEKGKVRAGFSNTVDLIVKKIRFRS